MFGFLSRISFSELSVIILQFLLKYVTYLGLLGFGVRRREAVRYGLLVTYDRFWLKWCGILIRALSGFAIAYTIRVYIKSAEGPLLITLGLYRLISILLCLICIIWKQIRDEDRILSTVNAFFKLFWRIQSLSRRSSFYGGGFEWILLLTMLICLIYELCANILYIWTSANFIDTVFHTLSLYVNVIGNTIMRIFFIGYLSVNVLYTDFNSYFLYDFTDQLRSLEESDRRNKVKIAAKRLDMCIDLYEDIQRTANKFHQLFQVPLFFALIYNTSCIAQIICKFILSPLAFWVNVTWGFVVKCIIDLIILSFAVDKAVSTSRVIRNLSFENEFLWEHRELVIRVEMFFGRLHLKQFRVRILGLFDISNRFILFCLSAIVTHVTIILQLKLAEIIKKG